MLDWILPSASAWCLCKSSRFVLVLSDEWVAEIVPLGGGKHTPIASTTFLSVSLAEYGFGMYKLRTANATRTCYANRTCHRVYVHSLPVYSCVRSSCCSFSTFVYWQCPRKNVLLYRSYARPMLRVPVMPTARVTAYTCIHFLFIHVFDRLVVHSVHLSIGSAPEKMFCCIVSNVCANSRYML